LLVLRLGDRLNRFVLPLVGGPFMGNGVSLPTTCLGQGDGELVPCGVSLPTISLGGGAGEHGSRESEGSVIRAERY
jgi:hypothetical protein